jgi:AraC-like DNA-binding protein
VKSKETLFFHSCEQDIEVVYCKNSAAHYPGHTHVGNYTVGIVLAGSIVIERNGIESKGMPGDIFTIPPNLLHSIRPNAERYSLLSLCVRKDMIYESELDPLLQKLQSVFASFDDAEILSTEQKEALKDAVSVLYQNLSMAEAQGDAGLLHAQKLLVSSPENSFPVDLLAREVCISPYHLIRSFKRQFGLTPHQFQIQNRVRKAQHLLRSNSNITEVALAAGFCDQSHFDKCFEKIVGMTPSEYLSAQRKLCAEGTD